MPRKKKKRKTYITPRKEREKKKKQLVNPCPGQEKRK